MIFFLKKDDIPIDKVGKKQGRFLLHILNCILKHHNVIMSFFFFFYEHKCFHYYYYILLLLIIV